MMKVAYNNTFGGFGLSKAAVLRGRELSGDQHWMEIDLEKEKESFLSDLAGYPIPDEVEVRTDPVLIAVIEELGDKAESEIGSLAIADVPSGTRWRIDVYDGAEKVMTIDDYEWHTAK